MHKRVGFEERTAKSFKTLLFFCYFYAGNVVYEGLSRGDISLKQIKFISHTEGYLELENPVKLEDLLAKTGGRIGGRVEDPCPVTHFSSSTYSGYNNNPVFWADPSGADFICAIRTEISVALGKQGVKFGLNVATNLGVRKIGGSNGKITKKDDYKVDKNGNISLVKPTNDKFDKLFNDDASKSLELVEGILNNIQGQVGKFPYNFIKVIGDKQATSLFKFLAKNTDVEWGHLQLGIAGNKGLNYLTTSHLGNKEVGLSHLVNSQIQYGYTIRMLNHNHPGNTAFPSGTEITGGGEVGGDISFAKVITSWYRKKYPNRYLPIFRIYLPKYNEFITFDENSIAEDFKKFDKWLKFKLP